MSQEKAIEKINSEMQKSPNNTMLEILGHYLIERCAEEAAVPIILTSGKTLTGAIAAIKDEARKQSTDHFACLSDRAAFDITDKYFGLPFNQAARMEIKRQVEGGSTEAIHETPSNLMPQTPVKSAQLNLSLEDFL